MIKLTTRQHSHILGWALVGFGIGNGIEVIRFISTLGSAGVSKGSGPVIFSSLMIPILYALWGILAGMSAFDERTPVRGILIIFAVVAFISFPLGTALSVYVLLYLYVINPDPELAAAPSSET